MRKAAGKTHLLYQEVPWQRHARADCYHCGTRERAQRMHWLQRDDEEAYIALCLSCYPTYIQGDDGAVPAQQQVV
jgi:hypothetical protein